MSKYAVVAAGYAYTDVVAHVSQDFLDRHSIPVNAVCSFDIEALKRIRDALPCPQVTAGGSSANTASIISSLGGSAGFFGKVSHDAAGDLFLEEFKRFGVELCCPARERNVGMSATCIILLTENGQYSFAYNVGGAEQFVADDFRRFNFKETDYFLIESQLLSSPHASSIIKDAVVEAQGKTQIVINLQEIQKRQSFSSLAPWIVDKANILIGNESEHEAIQQIVPTPHSPQQIVVMTKGASGAEACANAQHYVAPAPTPDNFVSAVGAGDAFTAGFLFGLSRGLGIERSLNQATRVAAFMLGEMGARPTTALQHLCLR